MQARFFEDNITKIVDLINNNEEKSAIALIDVCLEESPTFESELLDAKFISKYTTKKDGVDVEVDLTMSFIYLPVKAGLVNLVTKLIDLGFNVNGQSNKLALTPLMIACIGNDEKMVAHLLKSGADVSLANSYNEPIINYIMSNTILKIMIDHANKNDASSIFSSYKSNNNLIKRFFSDNNVEIAIKLMSVESFKSNIDDSLALHFLRIASWDYPSNRLQYNALCHDINAYYKKIPCIDFDFSHESQIDLNEKYFLKYFDTMEDLFNIPRKVIIETASLPKTKTQAVQIVIAQIKSIADITPIAAVFFKYVEKELVRYIKETQHKDPERLAENATKFTVIDGVKYRIPALDQYQGLSKSHALQELLIIMLRSHGLAKNTYKWVGGIPTHIASTMLKNGDFCTEDRLGVGVLHGKLSHMFHLLLCIYAIKSGLAHINYKDDNGEDKQVTIQDVLEGLFNYRHPTRGRTLFKTIFDVRRFGEITFADPFRLESLLTCFGKELECGVLSEHLTDSLCKGLLRLKDAHNRNRSDDAYHSLDDFLEHLSDLQTTVFKYSDSVEKITLANARERYPNQLLFAQPHSIVVEKKYTPNPHFTPNPFNSRG